MSLPVKHFVVENYKKRNLNKQEEYELIRKAQEGDHVSKEELILTNLAFIKKKAALGHRLCNRADTDDYIQVSILGFMESIDKFDFSFDGRLKTYGAYYIKKNVHRLARTSHLIYIPDYLWKTDYDKNSSIYEALGITLEAVDTKISKEPEEKVDEDRTVINSVEKDFIRQMLKGLNKFHKHAKDIIYGYYFHNKTQIQIGKELGLSKHQVFKLRHKTLDYLQRYLKRRNISHMEDIV